MMMIMMVTNTTVKDHLPKVVKPDKIMSHPQHKALPELPLKDHFNNSHLLDKEIREKMNINTQTTGEVKTIKADKT